MALPISGGENEQQRNEGAKISERSYSGLCFFATLLLSQPNQASHAKKAE
jgi:hypothetical protein